MIGNKGVKRVTGTISPKIGEETTYKAEVYPSTPNTDEVKWILFEKKNGILKKSMDFNGKGPTCPIEFKQGALGKQYLIEAYAYNPEKKVSQGILVKPIPGPPHITTIAWQDENGAAVTQRKFGQKITLFMEITGLEGEPIEIRLYDEDTSWEESRDVFTVFPKKGIAKLARTITPVYQKKEATEGTLLSAVELIARIEIKKKLEELQVPETLTLEETDSYLRYKFTETVQIEGVEMKTSEHGNSTITISKPEKSEHTASESNHDNLQPPPVAKKQPKKIFASDPGNTSGEETSDDTTPKPKVEKIEFLDENDNILNQNTKDFLYGRKLKIRVTTKDAEDGTLVSIWLKGKSERTNQKFKQIQDYKWTGQPIKSNQFETPFFALSPSWYSDDHESYDYDEHKTTIKEENLNTFFAQVMLNAEEVTLPPEGERLKPIAYKRNYEELIGLFHTNNSGEKDLLDNYENKFIKSVGEIERIVNGFNEFIYKITKALATEITTPEKAKEDIKKEVEKRAAALWETAVGQVQGHTIKTDGLPEKTIAEMGVNDNEKVPGNLDDRPLYWARNKMQVALKRHPLFYEDIDSEKSIVKNDTDLAEMITLFEEKSRNYTGIDFSKAGDKKKVLITGFDPFQLDPDSNYYGFNSQNVGIETFNPSGLLALQLNSKQVSLLDKDVFIQTCIFPVRYEDFDKNTIENIIGMHFDEVDVIMTSSRNSKNWDIERYAIAYRGGFHDNINIGNSKNNYDSSRFIANTSSELTETTIPKVKIFGGLNQVQIGGQLVRYDETKSSTMGSGNNYLSNEIMYRTTKLRDDRGSDKPVGHFHIYMFDDISKNKLVEKVTLEILEKIVQ